jgi:hypothetical protein
VRGFGPYRAEKLDRAFSLPDRPSRAARESGHGLYRPCPRSSRTGRPGRQFNRVSAASTRSPSRSRGAGGDGRSVQAIHGGHRTGNQTPPDIQSYRLDLEGARSQGLMRRAGLKAHQIAHLDRPDRSGNRASGRPRPRWVASVAISLSPRPDGDLDLEAGPGSPPPGRPRPGRKAIDRGGTRPTSTGAGWLEDPAPPPGARGVGGAHGYTSPPRGEIFKNLGRGLTGMRMCHSMV